MIYEESRLIYTEKVFLNLTTFEPSHLHIAFKILKKRPFGSHLGSFNRENSSEHNVRNQSKQKFISAKISI